jgi:uncharacterized damage-inducible protein DinB
MIHVLAALTLALGLQAPAAPAPAVPSQTLGASTASLYRSVRGFLLNAAKQMPEEHYGFKPTPDVRSFAQLVGHVTNTQYNFCGPVVKKKGPAINHETLTTKAELVAALEASLVFCDEAFEGLTDERLHAPAAFGQRTFTAGYLLMFNVAHDNEHYGNMVTYLRLKGLVPPSTSRSGGGGEL